MSDWIGPVAASWGVIMGLSPLLQARRIIVRRSSRDVSIAYLGVLIIGFGLWIGYGASIASLTIVVPNSVAFVVGSATVLVAMRFRAGG